MSNIPVLTAPTAGSIPATPAPPLLTAPTAPITSSPSNPTAPVLPLPPQPTLTPYQQDSLAYLRSVLDRYGLGSLSDWAYNQLILGNSPDQIMQELRERPEFKQRFPAIEARKKAGLSPLSVDEILAFEKQARYVLHASGLPLGFYDSQDELQNFIAQDVSVSELSSRIQLAAQDFFSTDATLRDELSRLYNLTPGQHIAYILDANTALPLIQRQWLSASLSATAIRTQFGGLSQQEAEALSGMGVTDQQAQQGFSTLAHERSLFDPLPGEQADQISRAEQISAAFYSDATAQERIRRRQQLRLSDYQEGGGFTASQQGISGLGSAPG